MTRTSKKAERRAISPKKIKPNLSKKTGPKKDTLKDGYKKRINALESTNVFIGKI